MANKMYEVLKSNILDKGENPEILTHGQKLKWYLNDDITLNMGFSIFGENALLSILVFDESEKRILFPRADELVIIENALRVHFFKTFVKYKVGVCKIHQVIDKNYVKENHVLCPMEDGSEEYHEMSEYITTYHRKYFSTESRFAMCYAPNGFNDDGGIRLLEVEMFYNCLDYVCYVSCFEEVPDNKLDEIIKITLDNIKCWFDAKSAQIMIKNRELKTFDYSEIYGIQ